MNTRYKMLTLALLLTVVAGCKEYLNQPVLGAYSDQDFFRTADQAVLAINAAYQPLSFASDNNRLWVFGDVASDDADKGGDPGDQADIGLIDNFQIYPTNGPVESEWGVLYEGIYRGNQIVARVPGIECPRY